LIAIFLTCKIAKTDIFRAENFRGNDAVSKKIRYESLIFILILLTREIVRTHIILAQILEKNKAD
jgi:hypothetical protein